MKTAAPKQKGPENRIASSKSAQVHEMGGTHSPQLSPCWSVIQRTPLCPCGGGCPRCQTVIQPKLSVGQPGDVYEQEADRVADMVMRMPETAVQPKPT